MGQSVQIVRIRELRPDTVRFEIDRSLTGTDHERYVAAPNEDVVRPPDVLAKRFFETGQVSAVHVFSNVITVTLVEGADVAVLEDVLRNLFIHYLPGVMPTAV